MKKRILSLLLAAAVMFSMFTFSVSAAEQQPIQEPEIGPRYTYLSSFSAGLDKEDGYLTYRGDFVVRPTDEEVTLKISLSVSDNRMTWTELESQTRTYTNVIGGGGFSRTYHNPVKDKYYRCLVMVTVGNPNNPIDADSVSKIIQY